MTTILQMQIVELASKGLSESEIARQLGRAENNIRVILSYMYKKHGFGVRRGERYCDAGPRKRLIRWYLTEFKGSQEQQTIAASDYGEKLDRIAMADPVIAKGRNGAAPAKATAPYVRAGRVMSEGNPAN